MQMLNRVCLISLGHKHLRGEQGGTGSDAPRDHRFGDPAFFNAIANLVLFVSSNL